MLQWSGGSTEVDLGIDLTTGSLVLDEPKLGVPDKHPFRVAFEEESPSEKFQWHGRGPLSRTVAGDPEAKDLTHATFLLANLPATQIGARLRHEKACILGGPY